MSRRFVSFVCTGRGTHKERRLRRFRWEPIADTLAAGPGPLVDAGDVEAWQTDVEMWREEAEAGVTHHLVEDARVRVVDGVSMSHYRERAAYEVDMVNQAHFGTYDFHCKTCGRDMPRKEERLAAIVRGCMEAGIWRFDISRQS